MRAKALQKEFVEHLKVCYGQIVDAIAEDVPNDINGHTDNREFPVVDCLDIEEVATKPCVSKQDAMKTRRAAIKTFTTVKSTSHAFLKDMNDKPSTTQRNEDEAITDYFIASYASHRTLFQHAVTRDRESFGAHVHDTVDTIKDPSLPLLKLG